MSRSGNAVVAVVDDDRSVLQAYARLLRLAGHEVRAFACAEEFLRYAHIDEVGCLVLDMLLPDLNGLELQARLQALDHVPPIVFITGHGDVPSTVRAMRAGAVDLLTKPCSAAVMLEAVGRALRRYAVQRQAREELDAARSRIAALTPREQDVLRGIVAGLRNKQIGLQLDISEKTVKVHRNHIMQKTHAGSVAELVRLADRIGLTNSQGPDSSVSAR